MKIDESCPVVFVSSNDDYVYLRQNLDLIKNNISAYEYIVIAPSTVKCMAEQDGLTFVDENLILDGLSLASVRECFYNIAKKNGPAAWYFQQFLKMAFCFWLSENRPKSDFYLLWDGDTIPLKKYEYAGGGLHFDVKTEFHKPYFDTISALFPELGKLCKYSFISEHMIISCDVMKEMIKKIESNVDIKGNVFWEKILCAVPETSLLGNGFSEFETYGTYCFYHHPKLYSIKKWDSLRDKKSWLSQKELTPGMIKWLSKKYDAVSFEKWFVPDPKKYKMVMLLSKVFSCKITMFIVKLFEKIWK